jgi:hypothetical protein
MRMAVMGLTEFMPNLCPRNCDFAQYLVVGPKINEILKGEQHSGITKGIWLNALKI